MSIGVIGDRNTLKTVLKSIPGFVELNLHNQRDQKFVINTGLTPVQLSTDAGRYRYVDFILNPKLVTNKLEQVKAFHEEGVSTPEYRETGSAAITEDWIIKPRFSQQGRGIQPYVLDRSLAPTQYLQKKVNKSREFRVHAALFLPGSQGFSIQEKLPKEGFDNSPLCWNIDNNFYYKRSTTPENHEEKYQRTGLFRRLTEIAVKALTALKYHFGAVDIAMDTDRNLFVFEVNSHPHLKNDESKRIYKTTFEKLHSIDATTVPRFPHVGRSVITFTR